MSYKELDYIQLIFQVGEILEQNFWMSDANKIQTMMYFGPVLLLDVIYENFSVVLNLARLLRESIFK